MPLRGLASIQRFLIALWPCSIGNQYLLMLPLGLLVGCLLPSFCHPEVGAFY
jgi:hypothetical protein